MSSRKPPHIGADPHFPARPEHEDFDLLSLLINELDAEAEDPAFTLDALVARHIDNPSLAYLAMQRAFRVLGIRTMGEFMANATEVTRLSAVYHEGFVMGARFQHRRDTERQDQQQ